ncbi:MAG: pyruvate kinase [Deltaproteobacteria bacterium]|nr:pyruvate kinase [Deltaproteobacteria bacterium]
MRKTKIIATIGPSTRSLEALEELIAAGCNVIRINMSHSSQEEADAVIQDIRTISDEVAILIDTKGPEIRTTVVSSPVTLKEGAEVLVRAEQAETTAEVIHVTYRDLPQVLEVGTKVLINDGQISLNVEAREEGQLRCRVLRGGVITSKKGVNIPGVKLPMPFVSAQDESDIRFAARHNADFLAASFVGDAKDVAQIREIFRQEGAKTVIISKVESQYAVDNLDDIIRASDGLMVARGDLGVEIPLERVPVVQKRMIDACRARGRTIIVATEMLESMIQNSRPTRAETSDVANAIFEGADAVMLSGETSVGRFPFDAVRMMGRIAEIAEEEVARRAQVPPTGEVGGEITELICKSAWFAAQELHLAAIVIPTSTGRTARRMSRFRPKAPILATTPDMDTARRLALSYGVYALPARHYGRMENMVRRSCQVMIEAGRLKSEDLVAVAAGVPVGRSGTTNLLSIQHVAALMGRVGPDEEA